MRERGYYSLRTGRNAGAGKLDLADELDWSEDQRRLEEAGESIPLDKAIEQLQIKAARARLTSQKS